jgi:hypothetical protein
MYQVSWNETCSHVWQSLRDTLIPAAAHGVLCTGAPSAGASMDATTSPGTILERVSVKQP